MFFWHVVRIFFSFLVCITLPVAKRAAHSLDFTDASLSLTDTVYKDQAGVASVRFVCVSVRKDAQKAK